MRKQFGLMILMTLAAILLTFSVASAGLDACRVDPIVWLSDGSVVSLTARVATSASNVERIDYVLYAPRGVQVVKVVYTGGALRDKENVMLVADNPAGILAARVMVVAPGYDVPVKTQMRLLRGVSVTAYGSTGEPIMLRLNVP